MKPILIIAVVFCCAVMLASVTDAGPLGFFGGRTAGNCPSCANGQCPTAAPALTPAEAAKVPAPAPSTTVIKERTVVKSQVGAVPYALAVIANGIERRHERRAARRGH